MQAVTVDSSQNLQINASVQKEFTHGELEEQLLKEKRLLTKLEATIEIRKLVNKGKLTQIKDAGIVKFSTDKKISDYESREKKLQEAYLRRTEDVCPTWHDILKEERKEIKECEKITLPQEPPKTLRPTKLGDKFSKRSRRRKTWEKKLVAFEEEGEQTN